MIPESNRLQTEYEFRKVKRHGKVQETPYFILVYYYNSNRKAQPPRFGFITSKKFDKRAVKRNRARRLMQEAILKKLSKFKNGYDIVLIARQNIKNVSFKEVLTELNKVLPKVPLT